jgi:hypothetical protein
MSIPSNSTFSSKVLNLKNCVVVVGEYYYNHITKGIEEISHKMKRGDTTGSQSSTKRVIEWALGPNPKENVIHDTYILHAFAGETAILSVKSPQHWTLHMLKKFILKIISVHKKIISLLSF